MQTQQKMYSLSLQYKSMGCANRLSASSHNNEQPPTIAGSLGLFLKLSYRFKRYPDIFSRMLEGEGKVLRILSNSINQYNFYCKNYLILYFFQLLNGIQRLKQLMCINQIQDMARLFIKTNSGNQDTSRILRACLINSIFVQVQGGEEIITAGIHLVF